MIRRALALLLAWLCVATSARAEDISIDWGTLESPYLREVKFDFSQRRYFSALGHLLSERLRGTFKNEKLKSELMLAYAYLAFGMHVDAATVMQQLPPEAMDNELRNQVLMELANMRYERGDLASALRIMQRVSTELTTPALVQRKQAFDALLMLQQQQHDQAIEVLSKLRGDTTWAALGYFNLGTTLLRMNRNEEAEQALKRVLAISGDDPEIAALRDRANFVLGFSALRRQSALIAKNHFQQITLDSPFSNRALLGVGLAFESLRDYKQSLAAWLELIDRDPADRSVLDALVAVPYAYTQLGAHEQAVTRYKAALDIYEKELNHVEAMMGDVRSGGTVALLVDKLTRTDAEAFNEFEAFPAIPEVRYFGRLLESHAFQSALRNYRDLRVMQQQLGRWAEAVYSVPNMSETFTRVYVDQIAAKQTRLAVAAEEMKQYIGRLALAELEKRKTLLQGYVKEAFFNLGVSYDRGAAQ
jgi:tetratricopeptide (TPR) repeat protein